MAARARGLADYDPYSDRTGDNAAGNGNIGGKNGSVTVYHRPVPGGNLTCPNCDLQDRVQSLRAVVDQGTYNGKKNKLAERLSFPSFVWTTGLELLGAYCLLAVLAVFAVYVSWQNATQAKMPGDRLDMESPLSGSCLNCCLPHFYGEITRIRQGVLDTRVQGSYGRKLTIVSDAIKSTSQA